MSRKIVDIDQIKNLDEILGSKQDELVSGINIVTINGQPLLGSGDIVIESGGGGGELTANQDILTALNGQTVFNLSHEFSGVSLVSLNGVVLTPNEDYTIAGTQLTMNFALIEADKLVITYGFGMGGSGGSVTVDPTTFIEDNIVNGVSDKAPSQNIVYQALINKADFSHGHQIFEVNGLQEALDNKTDIAHTHEIYEINGLQDELDLKADDTRFNFYYPKVQIDNTIANLHTTITQETNDKLVNKQDVLASGFNISTINGQSLLNGGDIVITGGGSTSNDSPSTNDFEDPYSSRIKLIPTFGTNQYIAEGVDWNLALISKHYITYLYQQYNADSTPYGSIMGSLLGSGEYGSYSNFIGGVNRGVATGKNGYKYRFLGGIDKISDKTKTMGFFGLITGVYGGTQGTTILNVVPEFNSSTGTNHGIIGVCFYASDTNLRIIMKRGGIQEPTYIDLGSEFPIQSYTHYNLEITKHAGIDNTIKFNITNLLTGYTATYTLVDDTISNLVTLPSLNDPLGPHFAIKQGLESSNLATYNLSIVRVDMICGYK